MFKNQKGNVEITFKYAKWKTERLIQEMEHVKNPEYWKKLSATLDVWKSILHMSCPGHEYTSPEDIADCECRHCGLDITGDINFNNYQNCYTCEYYSIENVACRRKHVIELFNSDNEDLICPKWEGK